MHAGNYPCSSCKEIHDLDVFAPSGEYPIKTVRGKTLKNVSSLSNRTLI